MERGPFLLGPSIVEELSASCQKQLNANGMFAIYTILSFLDGPFVKGESLGILGTTKSSWSLASTFPGGFFAAGLYQQKYYYLRFYVEFTDEIYIGTTNELPIVLFRANSQFPTMRILSNTTVADLTVLPAKRFRELAKTIGVNLRTISLRSRKRKRSFAEHLIQHSKEAIRNSRRRFRF